MAPDGHELLRPPRGSGRWLSELRDQGKPIVAVVHDAAFREDPAFIQAAGAAAAVAFQTDYAAAETDAVMRELRASRARIQAAADDERRRIERDLHDGAQQRLIALQLHLQIAAEKARNDASERAALRELSAEVQLAIEDIRSLTSGIYPAVLADSGLADAVRAAARNCPVATSVEVVGLGDYPHEISTAVYFCCLESLQNVAKHAPDATSVKITLRESNSVLEFSVSDDGPGLSPSEARVGAGIVNMRDRMATVGGKLNLDSRPGGGTRVSGRIPLSLHSGQGRETPTHGSRLPNTRLSRTRG